MAPVQEPDDNTSCPEGATKLFECQVIGLPRPSVRWYKDGINITTNSRYKFEYTPDGCVVLILENVTADDQGVYSCRAQNSEGSAETEAQLYIKGSVSAGDGDNPSVHAMASFKKVENEEKLSSKSLRRPLVIGNSRIIDNNMENGHSESDEKMQKKSELENMVDDLLELSKFGSSGRRLTTDSGITSRGSSFSSEPDISITDESIKEMKEYLHGKADALYQSFEHGKLKEIKRSDVEIIVAQSEKLAKKERVEHSTKQIMSMASLRKEKYDLDSVNELEASVLAGMYLFDTGPSDKVDEYRHGIPALELLVRKEALEHISDSETSKTQLEGYGINSNTRAEKSKLKVEYQSAEIIHETGTFNSVEVEKLNAINIERNNEIVKKHEETTLIKAKTVTCVEEDDESDVTQTETDKNIDVSTYNDGDQMSSKTASLNQATALKKTKSKEEKFRKGKGDKENTGNGTGDDSTDRDIIISNETTDTKVKCGSDSTSSELNNDLVANDVMQVNVDVSENEKSIDSKRRQQLKDTDPQDKPEKALDKCDANLKQNSSVTEEKCISGTKKDLDESRDKAEKNDDDKLLEDDANNAVTEVMISKTKEKSESSRDGLQVLQKSDSSEMPLGIEIKNEDTLNGENKSAEINTKGLDNDINDNLEKSDGNLLGDGSYKIKGDDKSDQMISGLPDPEQNEGSDKTDKRNEKNANLETDLARDKSNTGKQFELKNDDSCHNESVDKNEVDIENKNAKTGTKKTVEDENHRLDPSSEHDSSADEKVRDVQNKIAEAASTEKSLIKEKVEELVITENVEELCVLEEKLINNKTKMNVEEQECDVKQKPNDKEKDGGHEDKSAEEIPKSTSKEKGINKKDEKGEKNANPETDLARNESNTEKQFELKNDDSCHNESVNENVVDTEKKNAKIGTKKTNKDENHLLDPSNAQDSSADEKVKEVHNEITGAASTDISENIENVEEIRIHGEKLTNNKTKMKVEEQECDVKQKTNDKAKNIGHDDKSAEEIPRSTSKEKDINKTDENGTGTKTKNEEKSHDDESSTVNGSNTDDKIKKKHIEITEVATFEKNESIEISEERRILEAKLRIKKTKVSVDEVDIVQGSISKEELTADELNREKKVIGNGEKNIDPEVSLKKKSKTKTAKLKQLDQMKGNELMLCSAFENSDAGRHYTEPLKDKDLVYLEDIHPEIPNVINIMDNTKENEIREKDASLTEEIENKTVSVKDISENVSMVVNAEEIQVTNAPIILSVDDMNLTTLEYEPSLIEKTQLIEIEESETSTRKTITENNKSSIEKTVETREVEIKGTTETLKDLEREVSEKQLMPEIANTDNKIPKLDKLVALEAKTVEKVKKVEEEVTEENILPEKAKTKSEIPDIKSLYNVEAKSNLSETPSDKIEELIVPELAKKDEEIPDLQQFEKKENKTKSQTDGSDLDKDKKLAGEDSKLLENQKNVNLEDTQKGQVIQVETETTDTKLESDKAEFTVVALLGDSVVKAPEGMPAKLEWKISGVELSKVGIYKDGQKVKISDNLHVEIVGDVCMFTIDKVKVADEASYSVRIQGSETDHAEIRLEVSTSEEKQSTTPQEPKFTVEPVVDVKDERRLSIKCSVSGFPAPEVTWYHHGQQLDPNALWEIYSKDGYHYLTMSDQSILNCEEIVCRVENDVGYVQRIVAVKRDGGEVNRKPVLPPVSQKPVGDKQFSPRIEIEISEIITSNLRKLPLASGHTDWLNFVTLNAGDIIEVLTCVNNETVLARNIPLMDKVCYINKQALAVSHDVSSQVCENAAIKNNLGLEEQQLQENKEEAAMPERRKMKSPSPKMTSTPKMKRKEMDTESTEELQKRLGFSDNLTQRKEFSTPDSVEFTEYNDGTTRPMFKKRLKSVTAKSGEMAQLECTVSGSPLPKILWLKNNRPLKASDGCKVIVDEGTNILVFPQAREEDVGIYTARAMNVNGSIMCSAEFTLSDGNGLPAQPTTDSPMDMDFTTPAYFFQMSSCEVSEGRLARFDCRVVAYPKPEIVWMRDGKVIEAEQRFKLLNFNNEIYSLLVQDVRIDDTGRYTCWARNKFGEAMTEAYLNVLALTDQEPEGDLAPKFLTRFYDQQTTEGTATDFKCLIAGRPEPSVTWLLDDLEIRETPGVRMRHKDGTVSLEIKSPKVDQSGTYTCQLSNPLGEATCSASLTVVEDKLHGKMLPKFLKKFDHVKVKEGEEAKFTCVIVGEPRPEVMWLYDHKPISDTNRRIMIKKEGDAYSLIIKNVRFDDAGKITCKASNEEGEVYCSANLHVREGKYMTDLPEKMGLRSQDEIDAKFGYIPTFTKRLQDLEVKEGSRATFECKVMGIPDPEISWMKDGRVITPGGRFRMSFEGGVGQLVIDNVTAVDTGVYTCIVSNSQGKSSSTAALKLEEPKKERYTPDRLLEERTSRKERYTPDKYLLDDLTSAKRPYLDTDRYDDESSKQLDLPEMRAPPRLPTYRPIITDLGEETMRLAWRPVETYQARRTPPVSYRLEAKELPGKDWVPLSSRLRDTSHYLPDLARDRDYMIRVRAENDFGMSEPTEPLWVPRATAFPGVPITRPEIIDYEDTRAKLSWSRVDIPSFGMDDTPLLYMLEVEEPPHKDWRTLARDLDDSEYIVEGLKPGHDYRFRVRAKTPTGIVSEPSPAVSLYTKLAQTRAPVDRLEVLEYEPDTRSVHLSWDRVNIPPYNVDEEPLMYMLEYQEPPLPEWKTLITGIPTTRYRVMNLDRERDYNFRVRALTPYGISPPSPALPVTMRQTPVTRGLPEKVVISDVDAHSLRLTWRRPLYEADKPVSYQVEMLESPFSDWRPIATRVMETTYKVTGLKPTRDYQFRVIPQMDTEYLTPSPSAALTTLPVKPRLPYTEPRLKELTPESVQLSWGSAELPAYQRKHTPVHYKVEMAELPSSNWVPVARKVSDTSYTVTGLRPKQEYKFRIFAESDSGLSEPSMPATLYRRPAPRFPLKEPTIRDMSQNVVHLAWTPAEIPASSEGVSYLVEMQTPPGMATWNTLYRQHPTPNVRLADLRPDLDYLVRVRAQSGTYLSEPTLPVYIPRRAAPPRLPVEEPYAVEINPDFVKLQWRSADLPTHIQDYSPISYRLEAQELPDTNWVAIARGIPHTDFKVTGLNPQRDYNFRVRAENEYGLSDPTHPMVIRKRAVAPVMPTFEPMLYDIGSGSTRLSWRPATLPSFMPSQSPITYTLFVQDLPYKTWRPLVKGIPHTSYYVSGLQPDREYMFKVQAENQYGSSKPTDAVRLPRFKDYTRPISVPEVSDFDEDLTSVKLRWMPTRSSPPFDTKPRKYTVETWEPVRREWKPVARGVPDTSYQIRGLPKLPDHLFRVRMDTDEPSLSEPSMPVSLSRYSLPKAPMYRPQLYELEDESVRLSWQPVHVPEGVSRRSVRYTIEQREIPEPHWCPIATDIMDTSYKVRGLRSKIDYEFRVKALYDGISTEPSYPVSLFRRAVIPKVRLDAPEVYDVEDSSLSLRWNTVDVPAFTPDEEPLLFVIERQTLPSYEWQPVASNITDKSYTINDLKPYQDYNFRVRGVYPSGYTEPSPNVPVYRRPSESKIGLVGIESSMLDFKSYSSQKYSSKISATPTLPTKSLHATLPSPVVKKAIETRLSSYTSSPQRRYSVANIYDTRELYSKEADFKNVQAQVPEPKFKLENAYVYKRSRSPVKVDLPMVYDTIKMGEYKKTTPKKQNDLYAYYQQLHRRYSDAGIEELTRRQSRKSAFIQEKLLEERRSELVLESQQRRLLRRRSLPSVKPRAVRPTEPSVGYPSVADRYEDIKCPHIVSPGHWRFARRHSVALDWEDLQRLNRQLQIESKRLETKRRTRSEMPKTYKPKYDFISKTQDEYFSGTHFHIEDQLNFNDMRPRIPRVDLTSPYLRRSLSQERDPGYFILSKFSLSTTEDRKPRPANRVGVTRRHEEHVRPASLEPSPIARLPREYRSYTPDYRSYTKDFRSYTPEYRSYKPEYRSYTPEYRSYTPEYRSYKPEYRSYSADQRPLSKTRSLTPDMYYEFRSRSQTPDFYDIEKLKQKSSSLAQELARSRLQGTGFKPPQRPSSERQVSPVKPARRPSPPRQKEAFIKPRSYSISVPRAEVKKFNRIVEDSKSLITNYERLDQRSRQSSFADIRSDPRFTITPRDSLSSLHTDVYSDSGYSTTPRGSMSALPGELRNDPRYTSTPRGSVSTPRHSRSQRSSVSMNQAERERLASISDIKGDARFSAQRRATIATNDDLKSKLDTLTSKLCVPKKKKSSRPTIKYKSSRGEGAL